MSELRIINPPGLAKPSGYSYAIESGGGRLIHFSGHTAMTAEGES